MIATYFSLDAMTYKYNQNEVEGVSDNKCEAIYREGILSWEAHRLYEKVDIYVDDENGFSYSNQQDDSEVAVDIFDIIFDQSESSLPLS